MGSISQCFVLDVDWSAWSAIATFIAAGVALYVGVLPMLNARKAHRLRAQAMAEVLLTSLSIQGLHVAATLNVMRGVLTPQLYNVAVENVKVVDIELCRSFIPYLDAFPVSTAKAIGSCLAQMDVVLRSQKRLLVAQEGEDVVGDGFSPLYVSFLQVIDHTRRELAEQLGLLPLPEYEPAASALVTQMQDMAAGRSPVVESPRPEGR